MIENFKEKLKNGNIQMEFTDRNTIMILEKGFDPVTGASILRSNQEVSSIHLDDRINATKNELEPIKQRLADLEAIKAVVLEKEAEREALAVAAASRSPQDDQTTNQGNS